MVQSQRPNDVIQRSKRDSIPGLLQFPKDLGAHSMLMIFSSYAYTPPGERELNKVGANTFTSMNLANKQAVLLPLPQNIEESFSVNVQGYEAGLSGEMVSRAASAFGGAGDITKGQLIKSLGAGAASMMPDLGGLFSTDAGDVGRNAAFLGRRAIENVLPGAGRSIDAGLGNTTNPKQSLFFEGVTLKQPSFSWIFAPQSQSDSDVLKDITNLVKRNVLPSYGSVAGFNRAILNYPSMVDIFFLGIDQSYFLFYKTCMVNQFSTNYSPNGLAFVKGGKPAMINMSMNLIEADIHTAEDYDGISTTNQVFGTGVPPGDATRQGGGQQ